MALQMSDLSDQPARLRAVRDLDRTLMVESAAGTGKTALMAARLAMQLARGKDPRRMAAITFTEAAAGEFSVRVRYYIDELLAGRVPQALALALPDGPSELERKALERAAKHLDQLTSSTIHAFCQSIITTYAVEAGIDPGATIMDAEEATNAFSSIFDQWIKRRLGTSPRPGDPLEVLSRSEPAKVVRNLMELGNFRREHRSATPVAPSYSSRPDVAFDESVRAFRQWLNEQPHESETSEIVDQLEALAAFYSDCFAASPTFERLWHLAAPPRQQIMRTWKDEKYLDLQTPKTKRAWEKAAANRTAGVALHEAAAAHFERVNLQYRSILGCIATGLVAALSAELDDLLAEYKSFKRAAALLDFTDLLELARRMLREHEEVRVALAARFEHLFVDEFQDTDPVQAEILFLIAASEVRPAWPDCLLRAGSLFLVGDPKQAIYSFRGADVQCYASARTAIEKQFPGNVIHLTANFRSTRGIIDHVNRCFTAPLEQSGQPGYVPLVATIETPDDSTPCIARLLIEADSGVQSLRNAEATAVADVCGRLIGHLIIRDIDGSRRPIGPGDIALLTPSRTDLWRYEQALEDAGLPIASSAGKNFFHRQEVQDLLALTKALCNPRDTLALGAFLRGPLVGLTEEELLDITQALLPDHRSEVAAISLFLEPSVVQHPLAAKILSILRDLRRRARYTTPAMLLSEAIERLDVRAILAAREGVRSRRALANLESFLGRARAYDVGGLQAFARKMTAEWRERDRAGSDEGRIDSDGEAIELVTMHGAKGLEWPVVIATNMGTMQRPRADFVHRRSDDSIHWIMRKIVPPGLHQALALQEEGQARERERLWYVVCTRARNLLILPHLTGADPKSWAGTLDLRHRELPELDLSAFPVYQASTHVPEQNQQTQEIFSREQAAIDTLARQLTWTQPSNDDLDRTAQVVPLSVDVDDAPDVETDVAGSRIRGVILHKLMEEALLGTVNENLDTLRARAATLIAELGSQVEGASPSPEEVASTTLKTLQLAEIADVRASLVPEWPVYSLDSTQLSATSGRIDAIAWEGDRAQAVFDWKSDVAPSAQDMQRHASQLLTYLKLSGAPKGAVVYMTSGAVQWINAAG